jgi:aminoglycoside phosphotransferase (APT) family kinase protein
MTLRRHANMSLEDATSKLLPQLQDRLAEYFGDDRAIHVLGRRACPYASSFQIDELDVRFTDGSSVQLVLKDLGSESMGEEARRARPEFLYSPQREINAYRWILPHAPAGAAGWYGPATRHSADRDWLLLDRVNGSQLWQVGDVSIWQQTAAWIAQFHCAFTPLEAQQLAERAGVLLYDEEFYWLWMQRAQRFADGDRDKQRIIAVVAQHYRAVVERLTGMPRTLIHGEFYASNVIVKERARVRVCPVDWEMVALAPGLIDLGALIAGWAGPTQRAIARAYLAAGKGNETASWPEIRLSREFKADLDCCRLHLAVRMLGWSDNWEPPSNHAHNWLAEAARISRRLQ